METPLSVDTTVEAPPRGPGSLLTEARLKLGLDPKNVAEMLHLREHQIRSLEADDYDNLPEPTYVKGYLRAYCQLLSLDPDRIISMYARFAAPPVKESFEGIAPEKQAASNDHLIKLVSVVMVALIAGLAIAFWLGSAEEPGGEPPAAMLQQADLTPQPEQNAAGDMSSEARPLTEIPDSVTTESDTVSRANSQTATPAVPVKPAPANTLPTQSQQPNTPDPLPAPSGLPEANVPRTATAPDIRPRQSLLPPQDTSIHTNLLVKVIESSWIDIRDANGNKLLYEKVPAGREIPLEGLAPFSVFLGNADGVKIVLEGSPFELTPHKRGLTARFKINRPTGSQ